MSFFSQRKLNFRPAAYPISDGNASELSYWGIVYFQFVLIVGLNWKPGGFMRTPHPDICLCLSSSVSPSVLASGKLPSAWFLGPSLPPGLGGSKFPKVESGANLMLCWWLLPKQSRLDAPAQVLEEWLRLYFPGQGKSTGLGVGIHEF